MKKAFVAILAVLYLATSTGASLNMHYCMGKLSGWEVGHEPAKKCGKCGMKKQAKKGNGCCRDEQKFIKQTADHKTADQAIHTVFVMAAALPTEIVEYRAITFKSAASAHPRSHAPPDDMGAPLYVRNCVFLI